MAQYTSSRMIIDFKLLFRPFWSRCSWVQTIRLQQLRLRMRHYSMCPYSRAIYCERSFPKRTFRGRLSSGDEVFPPAPTEICGWKLSSEVPSSVATFRATIIEQPTKLSSYGIFAWVHSWLNIGPAAAGPAPTALLLRPCITDTNKVACLPPYASPKVIDTRSRLTHQLKAILEIVSL